MFERGDRLLEVGIVFRERQRDAVLRERVAQVSLAMERFGERPKRGEILGRAPQDVLKFGLRFAELIEFEERPPERDAGRQIRRVQRQTGAADADGLLEVAGSPALLRQLGEGDRRRVLLNPASKILDATGVGHRRYGTVTDAVAVARARRRRVVGHSDGHRIGGRERRCHRRWERARGTASSSWCQANRHPR